ncbi:hypothetical protein [Pseudoxanthomonas sp.]|uniref:hypothetical protein n=1 Tax=Pseudoxanthomonas sp. TaxID=1871049 RepID=UPI0025F35D82|nr:hypothetical protein [Pseudoxanthomonas sp.]
MSGLIDFERSFFAGIDFGQVNDWTPIAVIERIKPVIRPNVWPAQVPDARAEVKATPTRLDLVHLERIPLGTLYPAQARHIAGLLKSPVLNGVKSYADITGVGRGPYDMLKELKVRDLYGITITGSRGAAKRHPCGWSVGKAELVNAIQIEMQTGRLRIATQLELFSVLERELMEFRAKVNDHGHMTFNAREGQNDDLVLSVGYAVFGALLPTPVTSVDLRMPA